MPEEGEASSGGNYPLREINKHYSAFPVSIGDVNLGEIPSTGSNTGTQPNPIKISWSKSNRVVTHEIPNPKDKTIRTSVNTLWNLTMNFKTFRYEKIFVPLLKACNDCGPHKIKTGTDPTPLWMYITDFSFDQNAGYDDDYIEWNITFKEVND
jgi:hypothetical protein